LEVNPKMPIYEYRCESCGNEFEIIQKVNARPLRKCKQCSGKLEKLISRSSFQLKGGGWFINDYAGSSSNSGSSSSASASTPSESKSSSKESSSDKS
jgi:putative FmdB family regulatory protein